jgi:hypothetical protein
MPASQDTAISISAGARLRKRSAIAAIFARRLACAPTRSEVSTRSASNVGRAMIA